MKDFWLSCGHHLLDRDAGGGLVVTDEFLKAYIARPELAPPEDACVVEKTLHVALFNDPRRDVDASELHAIADKDARDNWTVMLAFRDHLLRHRTIEAAYLALVRGGRKRTPPLFLNQLTHLILRNVLDGCDDPIKLRAAELFYRAQRITSHDNSLIAADEELVSSAKPQTVSPLVAMLGLPMQGDVDIINDDNADSYWERSDRFDMAIDLTAGRRGHAALAEVLRLWTAHLLSVRVAVTPLTEIKDETLKWYVGLDVIGTQIGDMLWNGDALDDAVREQVVGLFRLQFLDHEAISRLDPGDAVFLILGMDADRILRMKPQNLIANLPVREKEAAI